jgi:hypothetical protein
MNWPRNNLDAAAQFQNCSPGTKESQHKNCKNGDLQKKARNHSLDGCVPS